MMGSLERAGLIDPKPIAQARPIPQPVEQVAPIAPVERKPQTEIKPMDPSPSAKHRVVQAGQSTAGQSPQGTITENPPPSPSPSPSPTPTPPSPSPTPQHYWREQQGTRGADTFRDYHNASGKGSRVEPYQWVDVTCRVHDPYIQSNSGGWWYRLNSSPWNDAYYAPASTFWNGDVEGQKPYTHNVDESVPICQ